jgi:hypothetical protein
VSNIDVLVPLLLTLAVTVAFFAGRYAKVREWATGTEVDTRTQIVVNGRLDDAGNLRLVVSLRARTSTGIRIFGEDQIVVTPAEWKPIVAPHARGAP